MPVAVAMARRVSDEALRTEAVPAFKAAFKRATTCERFEVAAKALPIVAPFADEDAVVAPLRRALDSDDARVVHAAVSSLAGGACKSLPLSVLTRDCLSRLSAIAMQTTSASIRAKSFEALAQAVPRLTDKQASAILETVKRVLSVDTSPATCMCAVGALSRNWDGSERERFLPFFLPEWCNRRHNT